VTGASDGQVIETVYERFGDEIVDELVEWLNAVDATYRSELREINEVNYFRFEAKVEQRIAELRAELLTVIRAENGSLRTEFGILRTEVGSVRTEMQALKAELIKWMFLFWAGTALAGLLLR